MEGGGTGTESVVLRGLEKVTDTSLRDFETTGRPWKPGRTEALKNSTRTPTLPWWLRSLGQDRDRDQATHLSPMSLFEETWSQERTDCPDPSTRLVTPFRTSFVSPI